MINKQDLISQLTTLSPSQTTAGTTTPFAYDLTHGHFQAQVIAVDLLAATFREIRYQHHQDQLVPVDRFQQLAEGLSNRLSYLLEPIGPIEFQSDAAVLQMRSLPPTADEHNVRRYYELLLRTDSIALRRYSAESGRARVESEITVTHEIFARLAEDFSRAHTECMA